jgi:hypothetical protein
MKKDILRRKKRSKKQSKKSVPIIQVRVKLISLPNVKSFKDFQAGGLIRVLDRKDDKFPEFALYPKAVNNVKIVKSLRDAGLKQEERGKWVLRTNKFNIFVYT